MKLNFNFPITNLKGEAIIENGKEVLMGDVFSNILISPHLKVGNRIKNNVMAEKIAQFGELEVDEADLKTLNEIAKVDEIFVPRVQCLLIRYLDSVGSYKE